MIPKVGNESIPQRPKGAPSRLKLKRKQHRDGFIASLLKALHIYPEKMEKEHSQSELRPRMFNSEVPINRNIPVPNSIATVTTPESIGYSSLFENISTAELGECKRVTVRKVC